MADRCKQSNILLCGSSRVGKSTLINAICQQQLAKTNASLNSVTEKIDRYAYEYSNGHTTHETVIWDTPGIESWNENDVRNYMASLIEETKPLCMIYCASPGSFAVLDHVVWFVSECCRQKIFCALVCTNMWAGRNRQEVVNEFCRILSSVYPNIQPNKEDNIIYYDRVALVTMVNSKEYIDQDFDVKKPPNGVEELIFGIAKCLNRDLMFAWFRSVAQNTSFWTKMSSKLGNLLKIPTETFASFCENAMNYLDSLIDSLDYSDEDDMPIDNTSFTTTKETDEHLFHDAVMVDMPTPIQQKKSKLTFKLIDTKMAAEFSQTLSMFGANSCKTEKIDKDNEDLFVVTAEFENIEQAEAIYKLCQLTNTTKANCTIVNE